MTRSDGQPSLRGRLAADARRGAAAALLAVGGWAAWEFVITLARSEGSLPWPTVLGFLWLDLALAVLCASVWVPSVALGRAALDRFFASRRTPLDPPDPRARLAGRLPWIWALLLCAGMFAGASSAVTRAFIARFRDAQTIAITLAVVQLVLIASCAGVAALLAMGLRRVGHVLAGRPYAAWALATVFLCVPLGLVSVYAPRAEAMGAWWDAVALVLLLALTYAAWRILGRRAPPPPWSRRRVTTVAATTLVVAAISALALLKAGANPEIRCLTALSDPLSHIVDAARWASDFDGDGRGALFGERTACRSKAPPPPVRPSGRRAPPVK